MNILRELRSRFEAALRELVDDPAPYVEMVRPAQDPKFGDFQANCAMPLGKALALSPRETAQRIVERLDVADLCDEPEIAGPGFINLRLKDDWLNRHVALLAGDERLGVDPAASPRTVVVDFSAPNVAKPMHVGHLRSTVIGDALCRVLRFLGHRVIGDNHIGDWGTQFGMIIYGYKHFLDREAYAADPVGELARLYRLVNQLSDYHASQEKLPDLNTALEAKQRELQAQEAAADPSDKAAKKELGKRRTDIGELKAEIAGCRRKLDDVESSAELSTLAAAHADIAVGARQETARLHAGDEENNRLWREFMPRCLDALQSMYDRLDIHFDESLGESHYNPLLPAVVSDLKAKGIAAESEGAVCVFLEGNDAPFIVRKGDGAFTYATTDLATIRHRVENFHADAILYVVDARQSEHFKLLFGAARQWGYTGVDLRHVSFGTILGEDRRPFKTRSGDTVGLESLIDEAVARARQIVDENDDAKLDAAGNPAPELSEEDRAAVAEIVGIGGIKYADLRHNRDSDYVFSWDKMLAKTGDTATYMQYAYARICGIFRKAGVSRESIRAKATVAALNFPPEIDLRMQHLMDRNTEGQLTPDERAELKSLVGASESLSLLQKKGFAIHLNAPAERALAVQLSRFAETLDDVVGDYRPNLLTNYLFETANRFSRFYDECTVIKEPDEAIRGSRLLLCDLTARVLEEGLRLLGIRTAGQM